MTNKVLLGLIMAVAVGVVVVGATDKARVQPAAAITAVSKTEVNADIAAVAVDTQEAKEIVDTAQDSNDLSTFVAVTQAIDFAALLEERGGSYTVFAPTNAAFQEKYGSGGARAVLSAETNASLTALLKYHVVAGRQNIASMKDGSTLTTLSGEQIVITHQKDKLYINGNAMVVSTSETTGNSMVYGINGVLSPTKTAVSEDEGSVAATPLESTGKVRYRRLCTENGDGTVTIQDQQQSQFLGFLWWGSWQNLGEQQTGFSATGCSPFQGFTGQSGVTGVTVGSKTEATKDTDMTSVERRSICVENNDDTKTIQTQTKTKFLFFWDMWSDEGEAQVEKGSCKV